MIEKFYKNPNKKPNYLPTNGPVQSYYSREAAKKGITEDEYHRRQKIIYEKSKECHHLFAGVHAWPQTEEYIKMYGKCRIIGVCRIYSDFDRDEWPDSDNPMIVHAHSIDKNLTFNATSNFFTTTEPTNEPTC